MSRNWKWVVLLAALSGCNPTPYTGSDVPVVPTDAPGGGVISSGRDLAESIGALATAVRDTGGHVLVMETRAVAPMTYTEPAPTGAAPDVYQRYPIAQYTVEVVDALGEGVADGTMYEVPIIVGPSEFVYPDGSPRTDWTVGDEPPVEARMPPASGAWVLFGNPDGGGFGAVLQVGRLEGAIVSGDYTDSGLDVPLESLRL